MWRKAKTAREEAMMTEKLFFLWVPLFPFWLLNYSTEMATIHEVHLSM